MIEPDYLEDLWLRTFDACLRRQLDGNITSIAQAVHTAADAADQAVSRMGKAFGLEGGE